MFLHIFNEGNREVWASISGKKDWNWCLKYLLFRVLQGFATLLACESKSDCSKFLFLISTSSSTHVDLDLKVNIFSAALEDDKDMHVWL